MQKAYAYDEDGSLLGEYGMGGAASAGQSQFLYLPTASGPLPIAADIDGSAYAIHTDHLGTPRRLTQADGQAAWQWAYTPYGDEAPTLGAKRFTSEATMPTTGSTSIPPVRFNLRYPGQYFDEESGLHYNYFRSYNPATGRYTQGDPIGLNGGWNRFAYVEGDPLSHSDPLGLDRWGNTMCLPTHIYITQSTGNGKDGPTWGAAGSASNDSPESSGFMTFPANSFPDTKYGSPGIVDGTYFGTFAQNGHGFPSVGKRGPGVVLNKNEAIPTLGPNPAQGGMSIADYVHMHCQNYGQSRSDTNRGSAGCLTVRGDYCERLWKLVEKQCNKNVIVHVIRN